MSFEDSYLGRLRRLTGEMTLIIPATRAVILNEGQEVLCVKRRDNGQWNLPAGSLELGESAYQCMAREVREETGLRVLDATPIALYSAPRYDYMTNYGNTCQMFALVFRVNRWEGDLLRETDETVDARYFPISDPPALPAHQLESVEDVLAYDGRFILK
jgi:8-oxo-dGTP pyrophosphatase MutT (NUDIX family)